MKRQICITMLVGVLLFLTACGNAAGAQETAAQEPAVTAAAALPAEQANAPINELIQKQILENNQALWEFSDPYDSPWFYTFTDLDHNGRLEVMAATTQGTGIFTYAHYWEVLPDGSGIRNCYHENIEIEGPDDWPEIILDSIPCFYDRTADRYYYPCEGVTRSGVAYQFYAWYALCLKNGVAEWELLASKEVSYDEQGSEHVSCQDAAGNEISGQDYDSAVERRFAGMEKTERKLNWIQVDIPWEGSYEEAAAQQSSSLFAESPQVVITKNPTSEAIAIGGKTWFIAHADNAVSMNWQLMSPDGTVYSVEDAMAANPGLKLEVLEGDTIAVSQVPLSLNGWGVQAVFDGEGNVAVTEPAYLYVGDFVTAYSSVIGKYKAAYESGNNANMEYAWTNGISEMTAYSSGVGYALKDLDKNGIPELIIAGMGTDDFSDKMVYDLYTLVNGTPVNLATAQARDRYYVRTDNTVYSEGSGGAAYTYLTVMRVKGNELEDVEVVFTNMDGEGTSSASVGYYYQQGHSENLPSEKSVRITEGDFFSRMEQMESTIYVPPLTKIY